MQHPDQLPALKARPALQGGVLLMNLPPFACQPPPARTLLRARLVSRLAACKRQRFPGKLVTRSIRTPMRFSQLLLTQYGDQVSYLDHTSVQQVYSGSAC